MDCFAASAWERGNYGGVVSFINLKLVGGSYTALFLCCHFAELEERL
ncbi:MAG: hypothetical protein IJD28_00220 [Deferribacterales bacterium]|nr:hypothetical protein [Deferribacterales bacterium]